MIYTRVLLPYLQYVHVLRRSDCGANLFIHGALPFLTNPSLRTSAHNLYTHFPVSTECRILLTLYIPTAESITWRPLPFMAPITDSTVEDLKNMVKRLELRVQELEGRLHGHPPAGNNPLRTMRMVLMGPPGAGEIPVTYA